MSSAYDTAYEILNNPERWEADEGHRIVVVYKDSNNNFTLGEIINSIPPYMSDSVDNRLWFRTLESAKRYARTEMYVEARFNKAK